MNSHAAQPAAVSPWTHMLHLRNLFKSREAQSGKGRGKVKMDAEELISLAHWKERNSESLFSSENPS